jgi:hypothetical protein
VQLFTGSATDPTILTGSYSIYNIFNPQGAGTIDITDVAAPVPEPSTWAMTILGFCGLGFTAYRKKSPLRFA